MAERVVNFRGGEQIVVPYPLEKIITSHNPRKPIRRLQRQGYVPLELVHWPGPGRRPGQDAGVNRGSLAQEPEIVTLARSIHKIGQCQPIVVRTYRARVGQDAEGNKVYERRGGVGAGERRVLACAYLEAERRIQASKGETPNRDKPWTVDAICLDHITVEEAGEIGWDENDQRQQMTDLDYGERFDALLRHDNPLTQKPYTIQEVADKYGKNYHWVRGRAALPYLPVEMQQQVEDGTCNITEACTLALRCKAKALNEDTGAAHDDKGAAPAVVDLGVYEQPAQPKPAERTGRPVEKLPGRRERRATLALAEVQALFDATPDANNERRQAFAEVMGLSLEQAAKASTARKEAKEVKEAREAVRRARKGEAA